MRLKRATRAGIAGVGANHFSTTRRKDIPAVFMLSSYDLPFVRLHALYRGTLPIEPPGYDFIQLRGTNFIRQPTCQDVRRMSDQGMRPAQAHDARGINDGTTTRLRANDPVHNPSRLMK